MSSLVATIVVERILNGLTLVLIFVLLLFMEERRLEQILLQSGIHTSTLGIIVALGLPLLLMIALIIVAVKTSAGDRLLNWFEGKMPERFKSSRTSIV